MTETYFMPSPKAKDEVVKEKWSDKYEHIFDLCPVERSFRIEKADVKLSTLRSYVSRYNSAKSKLFRVIEHEDGFEIYRKG